MICHVRLGGCLKCLWGSKRLWYRNMFEALSFKIPSQENNPKLIKSDYIYRKFYKKAKRPTQWNEFVPYEKKRYHKYFSPLILTLSNISAEISNWRSLFMLQHIHAIMNFLAAFNSISSWLYFNLPLWAAYLKVWFHLPAEFGFLTVGLPCNDSASYTRAKLRLRLQW